MVTTTIPQTPELVKQKLAAFKRIQDEFETCFRFKQGVHGQTRFPSFSLAEVVYYLHALWLCECKDRVLSIYKNIRRYEGRRCLELLLAWQAGKHAQVVDFLTYKLDLLPLSDITAQIEVARYQQRDEPSAQRLEHGRLVLLNRGINLMNMLDAIFSPPEDRLLVEVRQACEHSGHTPEQLEKQIAELETPLYAYRPHQLLAQCNMIVMNRLDIGVLDRPADEPGVRSERILPANGPGASSERVLPANLLPVPFAQQIIPGYFPFSSAV